MNYSYVQSSTYAYTTQSFPPGGCSEMFQLKESDCPKDVMTIMLKAYDRCSMKGCSMEPDPNVTEARTDVGLIRGHAYSITKVVRAKIVTPRASGITQSSYNTRAMLGDTDCFAACCHVASHICCRGGSSLDSYLTHHTLLVLKRLASQLP